MKPLFPGFLAAILCCGFLPMGSGIPTPTSETVTTNLASTGYTIPANFMGISEENDDLINGNVSGAYGTSWSSLLSMLGPNGVLRIGGDTSNGSTAPALTQTLANQVQTNLAALGSGWSLIYGLDLAAANTSVAITQAGYIINAVGNNNVVFQFGNEPDANLTASAYVSQWNTYYSALVAAYPSIRLGAPDVININAAQSFSTGLTPGIAALQFISQHYYSYYIFVSPSQLINAIAANDTSGAGAGNGGFKQNSTYSSNRLRLSESNTISSGGLFGISNTFASSAWVVNLAMTLANDGYLGINIHTGCHTYGTSCNVSRSAAAYLVVALDSNGLYVPRPILYGMILFSKITGQVTAATTTSGTGNVKALSTVGSNGNANILVVNNDPTAPVNVTPGQSAAWSTASVLDSEPGNTASGCYDYAPTLGGQPIGESGVWTGVPYTIANGGTVQIQPCGAALISIKP